MRRSKRQLVRAIRAILLGGWPKNLPRRTPAWVVALLWRRIDLVAVLDDIGVRVDWNRQDISEEQ